MHARGREGATSPGPVYMDNKSMNADAVVDTPQATAPDSKAHKRTTSNMSIGEVVSGAGRPLVQPPRGRNMSSTATARDRTPSIQYREGGRRQSERLEARAVRIAMEEMDLKSEESLYEAARDEAADLVWKHRNPDAPGASPSAPYPYPSAKGGSERSRSVPRGEQDLQRTNSKLRKRHSMGSAVGSRNSQHRRRSSGSRRKVSASLFKNPDDQIYEEPEEEQATPAPAPAPAVAKPPAPAKLPLGMRRNPFARVQYSRDNNLVRSSTDPIVATKRFDRYEIHKNAPSQSRNAAYTNNATTPRTSEDGTSDAENKADVKMKDGKEIRSDELRAATGFKLKDRSAKLPTPTMVSDSPGRPIVSFKRDWKPKEIELKEEISTLPGSSNAPSISVTPLIPTISMNETPVSSRGAPKVNAPSISVTPSIPSVNASGLGGSTRPLPDPKMAARKSFNARSTPTTNPRSHWTPTSVRTGALCEQCALPIAGRIVSAGGSRFHPECFLCHHCGEHLECVAFYPEPDSSRSARIARIRARLAGEDIEFLPTHPTIDDMQRLDAEDAHDESTRFYCHLDFHELFSPRCKSCKTPIEGEVVVACGAEWHPGHFFCAQCGDPFDSSTPFVEKEGYACTKCRKCKRPVTETVVKALGFEWHVGCFCCVECSGPFDDGRYFLRGESQDPVCVKCEERRLKA
ncbi:hypothetical protein CC80DRAFT_413564 [Byssothecium circinans]|uniref:LIM zinc-binding domain-containing protein n=1 Tax=Byssothecium circinans TaxID=147558 RepID=A0A6A5TWU6_9PLEO|nr:hypothetical protein CC80DRAFT_413564 [Byssothecium circinans]